MVCTYSEFFCSFAMEAECEHCGDLVSFRIDKWAAGKKKRKLNWLVVDAGPAMTFASGLERLVSEYIHVIIGQNTMFQTPNALSARLTCVPQMKPSTKSP